MQRQSLKRAQLWSQGIYTDTIGNHRFVRRVEVDFEANMIQHADREEKDRLGFAAYLSSGLKNLQQIDHAVYRFRIEGEELEYDGEALDTMPEQCFALCWPSNSR